MSADTLVGNYRELNLVLSAPAHISSDQNGSKKEEAMTSASPDPGFTNPTAILHDAECDDTVLQPLQRVPSAATSTSSDSSGGSIPINSLLPQILAAVSVSLGSMIVGFSSGYTSPALVKMQEDNSTITITPEQASWIGSVMPLAALVGGILGGPLIEHVGRRTTILGTALPFTLSFLLIALAWDVGLVLGGRALGGFCVGIASLAFPVYLGEAIQPEVRGTLGLLPTAIGNIGILLCFVSGKYLGWSELAIMGACLPIPFLICMLLIPETPRYLISKDRQKAARKALQWLRGSNADVTTEYNEIERSNATAQKEAPRFAELFTQGNLKPLLISVGLMFFQQFSGINAVIFYTVSIFQMAGSTIEDNLATIILGIVNFLATFVATVLIDRLGRKVLLYISGCTMIVTLAVLGTFFYLKDVEQHDMTSVGWLPLACFVLYVVGFSLGFGPIPWLMMGEILPARVRGTAASVATAFNWACTFLVTKTFLDLIRVAGTHGAFWIFGAICIVAMVFVRICVPETQGRSLEDIEKSLTGRRVRRMSSVANLKPMPLGV